MSKNKKAILVNLYGAPGAGKSTGAAHIFAGLKERGINAEQVTEFAKDKCYEGSVKVFENQAYIFGKQFFRISRCENEATVIVTDSPLLLSVFYNNDERLGEEFNTFVMKVVNSYESLNFFVNRVKQYNPSGRFQTETESDAIAVQMKEILKKENVPFENIAGNADGYEYVIEEIIKCLNS